MSAHTPGPWELFEHSWSDSSICGGPKNIKQICALSIYGEATEENQSVLESEMGANSRLIAAAPDLLEALIEAHNSLEDMNYSKSGYILTKVRSAIAKATGGKQP